MNFDTESTICAVATGAEGALRGAIRITGPNTLAVVSNAINDSADWKIKRATRLERRVVIDPLGAIDLDVFLWPDGRSYTGQPSAELHCLGNVIILQAIQERLLAHGAILAQPGEFTLRAFLAGRLDLTQCEAVLGVIHAANERSLNVALSQLAGGLSEPLQALKTTLVHLLADIEAGLDFVEEDISFVSKEQILHRLTDGMLTIDELLDQMESRAGQTTHLQVAVVGPPNAGKSSLINAMAKKSVSIVSPEPGTTRDYVRLRLDLDGTAIDILDTAGLEDFQGESPRAIAQAFTRQQVIDADLILYCLAPSDLDSSDWEAMQTSAPVWLIRTKSDLEQEDSGLSSSYERCFSVSVSDTVSLDELVRSLRIWAADKMERTHHVVPVTAARCRASLTSALEALSHAKEAATLDRGDEVTASEIRLSLEEIGLVAGTVYTDDILDALFSRFCIGK